MISFRFRFVLRFDVLRFLVVCVHVQSNSSCLLLLFCMKMDIAEIVIQNISIRSVHFYEYVNINNAGYIKHQPIHWFDVWFFIEFAWVQCSDRAFCLWHHSIWKDDVDIYGHQLSIYWYDKNIEYSTCCHVTKLYLL